MNEENMEQKGLLLDDPRILGELPQYDLVFGAVEGVESAPSWEDLMPPHRGQGASVWCTAYSAVSIGTAMNRKESGREVLFSPYELFYRTGGWVNGNTLVSAAAGMRQGFVLEEDKPTPIPAFWSVAQNDLYRRAAVATPEMLEKGKPYAMKSFAVVPVTKAYLAQALKDSPVMLAIGIGAGYWNAIAPRQTSYIVYHCVTLTGFDEHGNYKIFDSGSNRPGYNGHHTLAADYEILYALTFVDLPNDWYETQTTAKDKTFRFALTHYGLTRDISLEQACAQDFAMLLKKHPSLGALAGRQWAVLVNALAYGGYTARDLLNSLTNERRTGRPIFDLNEPRARS